MLCRNFRFPFVMLFLLMIISAAALATEDPRSRRHSGGNHPVAEPAAIAFLGAGLVSLGICAKMKRYNGKKQ